MSSIISETKTSHAALVSELYEHKKQYENVATALGGRGKAGPPIATAPHRDPNDPQNKSEIDGLYEDLAELNVKIAAHNLNPPPSNNPAAVAAYNEECDELNSDLLKLQGDFAIYGIELIITPPVKTGTP